MQVPDCLFLHLRKAVLSLNRIVRKTSRHCIAFIMKNKKKKKLTGCSKYGRFEGAHGKKEKIKTHIKESTKALQLINTTWRSGFKKPLL